MELSQIFLKLLIDEVSCGFDLLAPLGGVMAIYATEVPLREKEFFIDNLLVRIHFIVEIILVDRPCALGV